jgi:hypothetical protein
MCRECVQEAGRESAENVHAQECRLVSWNMYQDYRPQSCRDPPHTRDSLERKARKRMRENEDRSPRTDDLEVSVTVTSNTNADSQKYLKYKRAKGLK